MGEDYRIYVRQGWFLTELADAPSFPSKEKAERFAVQYWLDHPDLIRRGIQSVEAHRPSEIPSGVAQATSRV